MFLVNLLHIFCSLTLIIYIGLSLLPHFEVDGQLVEDLNSIPLSVPLYYRDQPVIVERPIILTQPKLVVPSSNDPFSSSNYLPGQTVYAPGQTIYSSYKPSELPFDRDLEFGTERRRKKRKRRRKRRKRRRFG